MTKYYIGLFTIIVAAVFNNKNQISDVWSGVYFLSLYGKLTQGQANLTVLRTTLSLSPLWYLACNRSSINIS